MKRTLPFLPLLLAALACGPSTPAATPTTAPTPTPVDRLSTLPADVPKQTPEGDAWPPIAASGWSRPEPLGAPINTSGAEDSPFLLPDGGTLYFFFTPDVRIPAEKQLLDGVTGIWVSSRSGEGWGEPQRVPLAQPGEVHLDGCPSVLGEWMAFCSARAGNYRDIDLFTASRKNGEWTGVENWGELINAEYRVGEMHLSADGRTLYFASDRPGGFGGYDLWTSTLTDGAWGEPVNLGPTVNTAGDENRPFVNADETELWFDGVSTSGQPGPAVFRSPRAPDGSWAPPEEIIASFAGEPTLTGDGQTLYFVHPYFSADLSQMIEADLYVSRREGP